MVGTSVRIGVDLGGTKIEAILVDPTGTERARRRIATPIAAGYAGIIDAITTLVWELEAVAGGPCTVGIGSPGSLSHRTGAIKNANTTCLNGRPLADDLSQRLERPIRLENDANCLALSEARDGAARGKRCVFAVILGTGVGGGIVIDGRLWSGHQRIAGEWGHNRLEENGNPCYCGRRGCVETRLSGPGLAADYHALGGPRRSAEDIASRTEQDSLADLALNRYMERFGQALALVVNVLDPDIIVLGGGLSAIPALYTQGRAALGQATFTDDFITPIVPALHGASSGVRGAAHLWPA